MSAQLNRRTALGLGSVAAAATVLGTSPADAAQAAGTPAKRIAAVYQAQTQVAGGTWNSHVSLPGSSTVVIDAASDTVVQAESVNKIAVATAVLDKIDRGLLTLSQTVQVTSDIVIADGDGIFRLDGAYPSTITLGHVLAALLTVSDDTAVRLCGLVAPAAEINQIMVAKGFPQTQVTPVANPNRFYLGQTTPKEMHDILAALVGGTLLSATSTTYLLGLIRSPIAFTDGIRRTMSSDERARIATKAGWLDNVRNEAGIVFDASGSPELIYSLFANGMPTGAADFGATNPAVQARSVMGRCWLDALDGTSSAARTQGGARRYPAAQYRPVDGG
ncbi:MAG TPA: serine hydrolase [Pseudonocardiaceae bacterium]